MRFQTQIVLPTGLEPARLFKQRILSPLRLPFPSQEHGWDSKIQTYAHEFKARCLITWLYPNIKYLWRESNSQFKLILNQLCLPVAPHRHGCPEVNRTPALWFRATRSTAKLQDNIFIERNMLT